jgi:hypothetical protein
MDTKNMLNTDEMQQIPEHLREKVQALQNEPCLADEWVKAQEASDKVIREVMVQSIKWFGKQTTVTKIGIGCTALLALAINARR